MNKYSLISIIFLLALISCQQADRAEASADGKVDLEALKVNALQPAKEASGTASIDDYWRQGKAELNHYKLKQNRYRDIHEGEAVLVFVLEDFLYQKQVKNDYYRDPNSTPVLKTNKMLRFPTGLYDYSMMTSTFTPIDNGAFPYTLKVTHSGQDWCGQVFSQMNRTQDGFRLSSFSYFEGEGDESKEFSGEWLEDGLFIRIRLNPASLPTGKVKIVPSSDVLRFMHLTYKAYNADVAKADYKGDEFEGEQLKSLKVSYPDLRRELEIVYEGVAPYEVLGWKDSYPSALDRKIRTTLAVRDKKLFNDYWSKNKLSDQDMRKEFGLQTFLP